jgi:Putative prokaryotic signal transducing protein
MEELLRTNDMVLISYIESMLNDAGIRHHVMDINMSVIEGSLGVLPRRIMVDSDQVSWARRIVKEADIDIL